MIEQEDCCVELPGSDAHRRRRARQSWACRVLSRAAGSAYPPWDEPPTDGSEDDADWLVLIDSQGQRVLTVQEKTDMVRPTWPSEEVSMQMHMDFRVPTIEELDHHRERAEALGATLLYDRSKDEGEPLYVLAIRPGTPSACWSVLNSRRPR